MIYCIETGDVTNMMKYLFQLLKCQVSFPDIDRNAPHRHPRVKVCVFFSDRGKRGAFSELTGSMSRAAGKKINRIITFSKKKPPLPGEPSSSSGQHDNPRCGKYARREYTDLQVFT